jgi:hypothetical protein
MRKTLRLHRACWLLACVLSSPASAQRCGVPSSNCGPLKAPHPYDYCCENICGSGPVFFADPSCCIVAPSCPTTTPTVPATKPPHCPDGSTPILTASLGGEYVSPPAPSPAGNMSVPCTSSPECGPHSYCAKGKCAPLIEPLPEAAACPDGFDTCYDHDSIRILPARTLADQDYQNDASGREKVSCVAKGTSCCSGVFYVDSGYAFGQACPPGTYCTADPNSVPPSASICCPLPAAAQACSVADQGHAKIETIDHGDCDFCGDHCRWADPTALPSIYCDETTPCPAGMSCTPPATYVPVPGGVGVSHGRTCRPSKCAGDPDCQGLTCGADGYCAMVLRCDNARSCTQSYGCVGGLCREHCNNANPSMPCRSGLQCTSIGITSYCTPPSCTDSSTCSGVPCTDLFCQAANPSQTPQCSGSLGVETCEQASFCVGGTGGCETTPCHDPELTSCGLAGKLCDGFCYATRYPCHEQRTQCPPNLLECGKTCIPPGATCCNDEGFFCNAGLSCRTGPPLKGSEPGSVNGALPASASQFFRVEGKDTVPVTEVIYCCPDGVDPAHGVTPPPDSGTAATGCSLVGVHTGFGGPAIAFLLAGSLLAGATARRWRRRR